jgi:FkbM family methyltransferase
MNLTTRVGTAWRSMPPGIRNFYHCLPMPVRRLINRAVFEEQQQVVEVQTGLMRGTKLRLSQRRESGYYLGTHEPDLQESLAHFTKPGMTVFDIGANIGFFAVAAANLVGHAGKVVAFEPNPAVVARLKENVEMNGLSDGLKIEQIAVGDFDGTAEFCFALTHLQGRFSDLPYVPHGAESTPVPCRTIDSYVISTGLVPDVVIMDVEHAEGRVLKGMKSVLQHHKPLVFIEMHGYEAIREAFKRIITADYRLFKLPTLDSVQEMNEIEPLSHFLAMSSSKVKLLLDSVA